MTDRIPPALVELRYAKYISLTTFRKSGLAVATPVWFAIDGSAILIFTGAQTGKAKRISHTSEVTIARCTLRGRVTGREWPGTARALPVSDESRVMDLITHKYRIAKPLFGVVVGAIRLVLRRPQTHSVYIEIQLA